MNYCSHCGSKNLIKKIPEGDNIVRNCCNNCNAIFYSNPKLVVGCLPVFEEKVLLCRRAIEPRLGLWNLPAGYLEDNEKSEDGAKREAFEEAGIEVEIIRPHCIYNLPHANQVYIHFLANMKSPNFEPGIESLEVKLFKEKEIPWNEIAFSSTAFALKKYFSDRKHKSMDRLITEIGSYDNHPGNFI